MQPLEISSWQLISIDPGSTNFAYAVFDMPSQKLLEAHTVNLGGEHSPVPALTQRLFHLLAEIKRAHTNIRHVLVEQQCKSFRQGLVQGLCCGYFHGELRLRSAKRVKDVFQINHPNYVVRKRLAQEKVLLLMGRLLDHNICDAILQALCFIRE